MDEKYRVERKWDGSYEVTKQPSEGAFAALATLAVIALIILIPLGLLYVILNKPKIILNTVAGAILMGILGVVSGILGGLIAGLLNVVPSNEIIRSVLELAVGMGVIGLLLGFTRVISIQPTGVGKLGKPIASLIVFAILGIFYGLLGGFLSPMFNLQEMSAMIHGAAIGLTSGIPLGVFSGLIGAVNVGKS